MSNLKELLFEEIELFARKFRSVDTGNIPVNHLDQLAETLEHVAINFYKDKARNQEKNEQTIRELRGEITNIRNEYERALDEADNKVVEYSKRNKRLHDTIKDRDKSIKDLQRDMARMEERFQKILQEQSTSVKQFATSYGDIDWRLQHIKHLEEEIAYLRELAKPKPKGLFA